jgi:deoxyhypusine synthase
VLTRSPVFFLLSSCFLLSPDEAVSWGKIAAGAQSVKVCADATIVFPLMVAQSFAKVVHGNATSEAKKADE